MDIQTLSTSMINQATAAVSTQNTLPVQPVHADTTSTPKGSDSVSISTEARVKAASIPAAASSSGSSRAATSQSTIYSRNSAGAFNYPTYCFEIVRPYVFAFYSHRLLSHLTPETRRECHVNKGHSRATKLRKHCRLYKVRASLVDLIFIYSLELIAFTQLLSLLLRHSKCCRYQEKLQKNLIVLAALADAQAVPQNNQNGQ